MNGITRSENTRLSEVAFLCAAMLVSACGAKTDLWEREGVFTGGDAGDAADVRADDAGMDVDADTPQDAPVRPSTWMLRIGGDGWDSASSVAEAAGGIVLAGRTMSFVRDPGPDSFDVDLWVVKLDLDGGIAWQEALGGVYVDEAHAVVDGRGGNALLAGSTDSHGAGASDMWLLEMDPGGGVREQKTVGSTRWDHAYALARTSDGGLLLAGALMAGGDGIVKLGPDGGMQWHAVISLAGLHSIVETRGGGYAAAGNWAGQDAWIAGLDGGGEILWQKRIGCGRLDSALAVVEARDGGLVAVGNTEPFTTIHDTWPLDMWICKLDSDGNVAWQRTLGGEGGESANAVAECLDGSFVIAGTGSAREGGDYDMVVVKMDAAGDLLWQKRIGGGGYEEARGVAVTSDGGVVVAGSVTDGEEAGPDVLVVKLGPGGGMDGGCSLLRDASMTLSAGDPPCPVRESTLRASRDGEVAVQDAGEVPRPSGAASELLCPE